MENIEIARTLTPYTDLLEIQGEDLFRVLAYRNYLEDIFDAAKENDVAVELNAQPDRLDLDDLHLFRAREIGVKIAINTDAHSTEQLYFMRYGIDQARRGWLEKRHVLNTMTQTQLQSWLKQRRQRFNKAV